MKVVECPRDVWQALPGRIPAEVKADYLRVLVAAGFKHIDAVSFLGRDDQLGMADAELVLEYLDPPDDVEVIGLVVDAAGAQRAAKTGSVQTLNFVYSLSAEFLRQSQGRTPEETLEALEGVGEAAYKAGMEVTVRIAMAFGNPFGEAWDTDEVIAACDLLVDSGVRQITLDDTVGTATPRLVAEVMADAMGVHDEVEIGVHLRAGSGGARDGIAAAYEAGCRRFDGVIGGAGREAMLGGVATEVLLAELKRLGADLPEMRPLESLVAASAELGRRYGVKVQ